ncbi:hypothetical protein M422DRAFT_268999 [Sphaerobolus stellatus SS14]|uniref:Uncharacterized protein n=1 Tax=Sphaerobolus stellatus (strain SS14) TaxID=990650 RepID=A0A0C9U5J7_SPHS4|nr:hypothetical protein M422DRAFT_268999 [Sphaerobolus stellatus SS14]
MSTFRPAGYPYRTIDITKAPVRLRLLSIFPELFDPILEPHFRPPRGAAFFEWCYVSFNSVFMGDDIELIRSARHSSRMRELYMDRLKLIANLRLVCRGFKYWVNRFFVCDLWFIHPRQLKAYIFFATRNLGLLRHIKRLRIDIPILLPSANQPVPETLEDWPTGRTHVIGYIPPAHHSAHPVERENPDTPGFRTDREKYA